MSSSRVDQITDPEVRPVKEAEGDTLYIESYTEGSVETELTGSVVEEGDMYGYLEDGRAFYMETSVDNCSEHYLINIARQLEEKRNVTVASVGFLHLDESREQLNDSHKDPETIYEEARDSGADPELNVEERGRVHIILPVDQS